MHRLLPFYMIPMRFLILQWICVCIILYTWKSGSDYSLRLVGVASVTTKIVSQKGFIVLHNTTTIIIVSLYVLVRMKNTQLCLYHLVYRPSSLEVMKDVEGVSEAWLKQYGSKMLQKIEKFCKARGESVKMDICPAQIPSQPQEQILQVRTVTKLHYTKCDNNYVY